MNSKHCTLLTLLLPLALFPILVFASGGEQVCSSQDFFQIIMGTYFFIAIIGLLLTAIMFYPKKFKKKNRELKELKEAHLRFSKLMKSFYYLSISSVFLIIVIVLIVITIFPESSTMFINENKDGPFYFLVAFIIIATILPQAFASIMIRRLVGHKVSNVGGEIGKFLGTEKNALIYFFDLKLFKEELASKHGPVWMRKNPEKEIKEIGWLLENVKAKIKIFELNPIENKDIFDKFRLSDELNDVIALSSSPKGHVGIENNVPLTVIISNGYIKEYWLGCDNCKSGLINFNVDKIGSMEVPTLRAKMIESSGFMLFVIFMGFIYIMTTKCADYFGDALNIPSLLLFILGLPILIMIVLSIKRVKMPPLYYTDHVLEKRDETKTNTS